MGRGVGKKLSWLLLPERRRGLSLFFGILAGGSYLILNLILGMLYSSPFLISVAVSYFFLIIARYKILSHIEGSVRDASIILLFVSWPLVIISGLSGDIPRISFLIVYIYAAYATLSFIHAVLSLIFMRSRDKVSVAFKAQRINGALISSYNFTVNFFFSYLHGQKAGALLFIGIIFSLLSVISALYSYIYSVRGE